MPTLAYADESPMHIYKDNYIIFGQKDDQVKFQISAEYKIFNKFETHWLKDFYAAYTQVSWWRIYERADTLSNNYQPEFFYRFDMAEDSANNKSSSLLDYIQLSPIYHSSTGTEGADHRSVNIFYVQAQSSIGEVHNFGLNIKVFGYWCIAPNNKDINKYRDNYESDIFYKYKDKSKKDFIFDKYEFHLRTTGNPFAKGYYILEGVSQIHIAKNIHPKILAQYCGGYGVNMVDYNVKKREFRIGVAYTK
jgi:outer membrane phospholipase A